MVQKVVKRGGTSTGDSTYPLAPSLPTCLWKSSKSRPLALFHILHLWLRYVDDTFVLQGGKTQPTTTTIYQLTGPKHTIPSGGTKPRWSSTIPGHLVFSRSPKHPNHHCLQKAHTNRPISTTANTTSTMDKPPLTANPTTATTVE